MFQKQPRTISRKITKGNSRQIENGENKKTTWQEYLKLVPLLYALIVIISFIKLHIFYQFFNINISEFLELGEILVSFLDEIANYLLVFAFMIATFFIFEWAGKKDSIRRATMSKQKRTTIFTNERKKVFLITWVVIMLTLATAIVPLLVDKFADRTKTILTVLNVVYYSSMGVIGWIFGGKSGRAISNNRYIRTTAMFFCFLLIVTIFNSISKAIKVKNYSNPYFVQIEYKNKIIHSDSTQFFIGMSNNYIFYYNKAEHRTTAFPLKGVGYIK